MLVSILVSFWEPKRPKSDPGAPRGAPGPPMSGQECPKSLLGSILEAFGEHFGPHWLHFGAHVCFILGKRALQDVKSVLLCVPLCCSLLCLSKRCFPFSSWLGCGGPWGSFGTPECHFTMLFRSRTFDVFLVAFLTDSGSRWLCFGSLLGFFWGT